MSVELLAKSDTQSIPQAKENLEAFTEMSAGLESYDDFAQAVYVTHELPFAIASLIRAYGSELYGATDVEPPVYGFFNQRGLTQTQGHIGTREGVFSGAPVVTLEQSRPRLLQNPRVDRNVRLFLTRRPEVARTDRTFERGQGIIRFSDLNARPNQAFLQRLKEQGRDTATVERAMGAHFVLDEAEARDQVCSASETLSKLSRGLLRATDPSF